MSATILPLGSPQAIIKQSVGLFYATMQRRTILNRLAGNFPTDKDVQSKARMTTSTDYPIVRNKDLTRGPGDRISFDMLNPTMGKPIMGDAYAQGLGVPMTFAQDGLHINVTRYVVAAGSQMSQQRTPHDLLALARANAQSYLARLEDQRTLVHLAGARGFHNNGEWAVPLASDSSFANIMINQVRAPSSNRHFMCNGGNIVPVTASASAISIQTTDIMSTDLVDSLATWLDAAPFAPGAVKFDGDELANDSPLRVLLVSNAQYNGFLRSSMFRTWQANSMSRASAANKNPLMLGDAGLWRGILIVKMPKPIRFFAGNALNHCTSATSTTETLTDLVPAAFGTYNGNGGGTGYAVDRALLLGSQALAQALGKAKMLTKDGEEIDGQSVMYSEAMMDYNSRAEVMVGIVNGMSKIQFLQDFGVSPQYTDFGVVSIDTAVRIEGA
jgi:N4-gp56 family major capsid protein